MRNSDTNVFKQLRILVDEFKRDNNIVKEPKNYVLKSCSDRKKLFLSDVCDLLVNSNYTCVESKIYLLNKRYKYSDIADTLEKMGKEKKENAIRQAIYRDKLRFERDFGSNFYIKMVMQNSEDIDDYVSKYVEVLSRLKDERGLLDEIDLDFGKKQTTVVRDISNEKFGKLMDDLKPYTKTEKERVLEDISAESLGYLKYILNYSDINNVDSERLRQFRVLLGIER